MFLVCYNCNLLQQEAGPSYLLFIFFDHVFCESSAQMMEQIEKEKNATLGANSDRSSVWLNQWPNLLLNIGNKAWAFIK